VCHELGKLFLDDKDLENQTVAIEGLRDARTRSE
jgi:hypothetical protein